MMARAVTRVQRRYFGFVHNSNGHRAGFSPAGSESCQDPLTDVLIARYVFPDGELLEAGQIVSSMQARGLEVRHLDSFREHYALTLREWVRRLEANWDAAVALTSPARARIWKLYMAACAVGFEENEFGLTQILATKTVEGASGMPLRNSWA